MAFKQITATDLGAVTALTTIGAVPNANAATISGNTLNLQPADASFGGVVTTAAQAFAGAKTFQDNLLAGVASTTAGQVTLFNQTNANTTIIKSGVATANITFTLPVDDGTSGQVLQTDGSGVLSWASNVSALTVLEITANQTITTQDVILADASGGNIVVTLPAATATRKITVKKTDNSANTVTISRAGADTVDGGTTYVLANSTLKPAVDIVSNQVDKWYIV